MLYAPMPSIFFQTLHYFSGMESYFLLFILIHLHNLPFGYMLTLTRTLNLTLILTFLPLELILKKRKGI